MPLNRTEMPHELAAGLDTREPEVIAAILAQAQLAAARAVAEASGALAGAARLAAACLAGGGRLAYAGAGSSGLMALADALELPGTFGIPRDRIEILFAGAPETLADMKGGPEDDAELARRDVGTRPPRQGRLPHRRLGQRLDPLHARRARKRQGARRCDRRARQQRKCADAGGGGRAGLPADSAGSRGRLDAHGGGHGAEDRAQHPLDGHGRRARPHP